uniref:UvrD-like helicase C-terminal domain-containing protein n=1 Tax=Electrophorus electricus TaxID=8005 RepID=A0A4W4GDI7_ELEEL
MLYFDKLYAEQITFYLCDFTFTNLWTRFSVNRFAFQGHSPRDIAVLFSTMETKSSLLYQYVRPSFQHGSIENINDDVVVMDTIRRFSGQERDIVFLVEPAAHYSQSEIEPSLLLTAYSRARIRLYVYHLS